MIDWGARIDELADYLAREYTITDREAIEILLGALVPCPRTPGQWLAIETNWFGRDSLGAWFAFGGEWVPQSFSRLRARYPWREVDAETREWLDNPSIERLFVECDWEKYPRWGRLPTAGDLLQRTLRLRTRSARTSGPLAALDKFNQERRTDQLSALTRQITEDRVGARPADPPRFHEPEDFLYHCELIERLAPWYPDWDLLVAAFAVAAVRRAHLYGRAETGAEDYRAMARLARDSVPAWIGKALHLLLEEPSRPAVLEKSMGLEEHLRRSGHGAHRELIRLRRSGLIRWNHMAGKWALEKDHREGIRRILAGEAFGAVANQSPERSDLNGSQISPLELFRTKTSNCENLPPK